MVLSFLEEAAKAIHSAFKPHSPIAFTALAGDTHNGGRRPLLVEANGKAWVLKFADPRPYLLMQAAVSAVSRKTRFSMNYPSIKMLNQNGCYLIPYIDQSASHLNRWEDVSEAMYNYGVICAISYSLKMIDAHLENVVMNGTVPVIIDPECIFYDFPDMPDSTRLRSTGIVCWDPDQSAIRSGENSMVKLEKYVDKDMTLSFISPAGQFQNRVIGPDGAAVATAAYLELILAGFVDAYKSILVDQAKFFDLVMSFVEDDFSIRYICRKTRHYKAVLEMLTLPTATHATETHEYLLEKLASSSAFTNRVTQEMQQAERDDLLLGDVPFFWSSSLTTEIRHRVGVVRKGRSVAAERRVRKVLRVLCEGDLIKQTETLSEFLTQRSVERVRDGRFH